MALLLETFQIIFFAIMQGPRLVQDFALRMGPGGRQPLDADARLDGSTSASLSSSDRDQPHPAAQRNLSNSDTHTNTSRSSLPSAILRLENLDLDYFQSHISNLQYLRRSRKKTMSTSSGAGESWISSFCSLLGHEYFAEVSEEFIEDDFNLTGLQSQVPMYKEALEVRSLYFSPGTVLICT